MMRAALILTLVITACSETAAPPPPPPPPPPPLGDMQIQISGAVQHQSTWSAFGQFRDRLASDIGELSLVSGQSLDTAVNRNLTIIIPQRLDVGTYPLSRYVPGVLPTAPAGFVELDTVLYATLPGGTLTISEAEYPTRPGLEFGEMQGTLAFRAIGLVPGPGGPVETHDTIRVDANFTAHWSHLLRPNVSVTYSGGPVAGTAVRTDAQSVDDDHGGRYVSWEADMDGSTAPIFPFEISEEFRLLAPAVGTFSLASITPTIYRTAALWPAAFGAVYYRDDSRIGFSTGGTLHVSKFVAPTDEFYGEIQGTLTGRFALWANDSTVTGDTVQVTSAFAVQLWPLGGIPVSPPYLTAKGFSGLLPNEW